MEDYKPKSRIDLFLAKKSGQEVDLPKPISRIDLYLAKWNGEDVTTPIKPMSRKEQYFDCILKGDSKVPDPVNPVDYFLSIIGGMIVDLPTPNSREEYFLQQIIDNEFSFIETKSNFKSRVTCKGSTIIDGFNCKVKSIGGDSNFKKLVEYGKNIFDKSKMNLGLIDTNGVFNPDTTSMKYSDFMPVIPGQPYTFSCVERVGNVYCRVNYYDKDKKFIKRISAPSLSTPQTFIVESNVYYVVVNHEDQADRNYYVGLQVALGTQATTYEEYKEPQVFEIPNAITELEGYGQFNGETQNIVDFENKRFIAYGHIVDDVWVEYETPLIIDITDLLPRNFKNCVIAYNQGVELCQDTNGNLLTIDTYIDSVYYQRK